MDSSASNPLHEDVRLLLPWFVNGTLADAERESVQSHLDGCAECREEVLLSREMMAAAQQPGATPIVPTTTAGQILDKAHGINKTHTSRPLWWGVAAGLAIVASLLVLTLATDTAVDADNQRFATATSTASAATMDYVLELQFADGVSLDDRLAIIDELGAGDVLLSAEQGAVRMVVSLLPQSLNELQQRAAEIASRREIDSAEFVALQVPVR